MINKRKSIYLIFAPFITFVAYWFTTRGMSRVAALSYRGDNIFTPELYIHWFSFFIIGIFCCMPILVLNNEKHTVKTINRYLVVTCVLLLFLFVATYYARYKLQVGFAFPVSLLFVSGNSLIASFISPRIINSKVRPTVLYLGITAFLIILEMIIRLLTQNRMDQPQALTVGRVIGILPYISLIIMGIIAISMLGEDRLTLRGPLFVAYCVMTVLIDLTLIYLFFRSYGFVISNYFFSNINQFFAIYSGSRNIIFYFAGSYSALLVVLVSNSRQKQNIP